MLVHGIPTWVAATNCWVVARDQVAVLIDVPPGPSEIVEYLVTNRLTVGAVILTHGHIDHMGGADEVAKAHGATTYVHPDDDFLTLHPAQQLRMLMGVNDPELCLPPEVRSDLADGDRLVIGDIDLVVRHTPGHTPGHCCFLWESEGILFSGDQLFAGSVGRTDLPGGSHQALMESMRKQILTLDDSIDVLPGHGPVTTIGRERATNPFLAGL